MHIHILLAFIRYKYILCHQASGRVPVFDAFDCQVKAPDALLLCTQIIL